jgi:RNA polymerase sigma-70 factor, ECF subfamily
MQGPSQADFEKVFREHNKSLCDLAYNFVRDKDAAQDIVQEVFLRLWKNREGLSYGDKIRHYLFKATAHYALNYLRYNKKITKVSDEGPLQNLVASSGTEEIGYKELEIRVRHAIDRLPPKCRAIYLLSRHEGLKYAEIADTLNLSVKTVENQMGIALEKLREDLRIFLSVEFLAIGIVMTSILFTVFS